MITPKGTKYEIRVVEQAIDPISNEVCGGDGHTLATVSTKRRAFAMAKRLKGFYEVHTYEETNGNIRGHWIFKDGVMIENMFSN